MFYPKLMSTGFDGVQRWVTEVDLQGKDLQIKTKQMAKQSKYKAG